MMGSGVGGRTAIILASCLLVLALPACERAEEETPVSEPNPPPMPAVVKSAPPEPPEGEAREEELRLTSPAFEHEGAIPKSHTGEAEDASPPLAWTDPPEGVESFALICDDPDAPRGLWVHWVIYNIGADARGLPEAVPAEPTLSDGARQGTNDFGNVGYGGPMPPPGKPHRYFFILYALDKHLDLAPGATKEEVEDAMKGKILEEALLMGTYQR